MAPGNIPSQKKKPFSLRRLCRHTSLMCQLSKQVFKLWMTRYLLHIFEGKVYLSSPRCAGKATIASRLSPAWGGRPSCCCCRRRRPRCCCCCCCCCCWRCSCCCCRRPCRHSCSRIRPPPPGRSSPSRATRTGLDFPQGKRRKGLRKITIAQPRRFRRRGGGNSG